MNSPSANIQQSCRLALDLHKSGNLPEAERLYLEILALEPDNFLALQFLGVIRHGQGRNTEALELIGAALKRNPNAPAALLNCGFVLKSMGRLDEALDYYNRAIALKPDYAEAYNNRGSVLQELGRPEEAIASYDSAIGLKPGHADAYNNRGIVLQDLERLDEALASYDKAIALKPDYAQAHYNRGLVLQDLRRLEDALGSYDKAIEHNPAYAAAYNNRGIVLQDFKRLDAAIASYGKAVELKPDYAEAYSNLGNANQEIKRFDDAIANHDKAIATAPDYAQAYVNKALTELLTGRLDSGWRNFEWRRKVAELSRARVFTQPSLAALEEARGKTILVHYEQGFGDTIQFCRYVPLLRQAGARVLFSPQEKLRRLMASLGEGILFADVDDLSLSFDYHVPLLSLPLIFGTTLETVPARTPYLFADDGLVQKWRSRLGGGGFKIGICWQGNSSHQRIDRRCFPLTQFAPLARLPGVRLVSLQKGDGVEQLNACPEGMAVETLGEDFDAGPDAFVDTAAVMKGLDLVITTETSVAHLAGALGVPAWVPLQYVPDWRWLLDRPDSPWYPSLRLFRQKTDGDWAGVFEEMRDALMPLIVHSSPGAA